MDFLTTTTITIIKVLCHTLINDNTYLPTQIAMLAPLARVVENKQK